MKTKFSFRNLAFFILSIIYFSGYSQTRLTDINPNGSSDPDHFVSLDGTLFFNAINYANSGDTISGIYKLVGSSAVLVKTDPAWTSVANLTVMGDYVYFSVIENYGVNTDSPHQLWRSNGVGAELIKTFRGQ